MGRKKLNRPEEELIKERKARQKLYYERHKERINAKTMKRYYENLHKV